MNTHPASSPNSEFDLLREQNVELTKELSLRPLANPDEKLIRQKMAAGLTREQAISAIKHQRAFAQRYATVFQK